MNLVIVESPAKAKTINKYLGGGYKVLASYGHIRDLPSKDGSVVPDDDFKMHYEVSSNSQKHVKEIGTALKNAESIYLATDPDREGEAISWHLIETLKDKKLLKKDIKIQRIVFFEITKKAVLEAINNPRDIDMNLVNAQQARRALDYLVGFTLSPVLWRKLPGSKSAGRVQSVALRLICEREYEIEHFTAKEYWDIKLDLKTKEKELFTAKLTHIENTKLQQFDLASEKETTAITAKIKDKEFKVLNVEKKQTKRNPSPPFTTSSLQQEASRKLGFGAKKTMMVAQKLYEGIDIEGETVGLITYMRTDSTSVSKDAKQAAREYINKDFGEKYLPKEERSYANKAKNAQEAHEAIRPTLIDKTPASLKQNLDNDQLKLYDLIWKRMVSSQMESAIIDQTAIEVQSTDAYAKLRATGSRVHFDGFYKLYRESKDDESEEKENNNLPVVNKDDNLAVEKIIPEQHFTQPPPRYTEASLVKKLEELGIGRPSTYASIISVLQDRGYVLLEKKRFTAEPRGRIVTAFLENFFKKYVEYDFTANLEDELDEISKGKIDWKHVLKEFWQTFEPTTKDVVKHSNTEIIRALNQTLDYFLFPHDEKGEVNRKCPSCEDGKLSLKMGKFGAFLGCSNYPECRHTKQLGVDQNDDSTGEANENEPSVLGQDPETGLDISVRKGPYGWYIQLGEGTKKEEKPKRVSIPKNINKDEISLEMALKILSLPREVGKHPETGKKITAGIGRFGPYINHDGKYVSLKGDDDVLEIGINRAITLIEDNKSKGKQKAEPLRALGKHPDTSDEIKIFEGRYGPYIKCAKINASIPKSSSPEEITLTEAIELIEKQKQKKKKK